MNKMLSLFRPGNFRGAPGGQIPALRQDASSPTTLAGPHFLNPADAVATATSQTSDVPAVAGTGFLVSHGLQKAYRKAAVEIPVLKGVDLTVQPGEFLAIVGQSGSGKSTLLHLLGLLDRPDEGAIYLQGRRIDNLSATARDRMRNKVFGMVFQFYHLLPELTTLENVLVPLMIGQSLWQFWRNRRQHRATAMEILEMVGLGHRLKHRPRELSGGEMQRAAIARALVNRPRILLADEPTGNLDPATGEEILRLIKRLNEETGLTILMVTHDHSVAALADRVVSLVDGRIAD